MGDFSHVEKLSSIQICMDDNLIFESDNDGIKRTQLKSIGKIPA